LGKKEAYKWGAIFDRDRESLVSGMAKRAGKFGLFQKVVEGSLIWEKEGAEQCRWVFIDDPSDIDAVRAVY